MYILRTRVISAHQPGTSIRIPRSITALVFAVVAIYSCGSDNDITLLAPVVEDGLSDAEASKVPGLSIADELSP